jgi:hypothetical protein
MFTHYSLLFYLQTEAARLADDLDRTSKLLASTESSLASEKEEITRLYGSMQVSACQGFFQPDPCFSLVRC